LGRFGLVGEELPALYLGEEVERSAITSLSEPLLAFLRALAAPAFAHGASTGCRAPLSRQPTVRTRLRARNDVMEIDANLKLRQSTSWCLNYDAAHVQPNPGEIVEQRLRAEAELRKEPIEAVRDAVLRRGLDAAQLDRQAGAVAADVVLVTATPTEHQELKQAAKELGFDFIKQPGRAGDYYRLGNVGTNRVVAMRVSMGAFSPDGAAARCIQARAEIQATTIILIGTAFGIDRANQKIGDVIVSESVFLYDDRRVVDADDGSAKKYKVEYPPTARKVASGNLHDRFRRLAEQYRQDGTTKKVNLGVILSGGAKIESAAYRDELVASLPSMDQPVIGGEMEGMGAISAALSTDPSEPGWVVVKGISDFADAPSRLKIKETRAEAARASAVAVLRVLQLPPRSA
jgi:nucleoside phosphorylase